MSTALLLGLVAYGAIALGTLVWVLQRARKEPARFADYDSLALQVQTLKDELADRVRHMENADEYLRETVNATAAALVEERHQSSRRYAEVSQAIGPGGSVVRDLEDWRNAVSGRGAVAL